MQCTNHNILTIYQNYIWIRIWTRIELCESCSAPISGKNMGEIIVTFGFLILLWSICHFLKKLKWFPPRYKEANPRSHSEKSARHRWLFVITHITNKVKSARHSLSLLFTWQCRMHVIWAFESLDTSTACNSFSFYFFLFRRNDEIEIGSLPISSCK